VPSEHTAGGFVVSTRLSKGRKHRRLNTHMHTAPIARVTVAAPTGSRTCTAKDGLTVGPGNPDNRSLDKSAPSAHGDRCRLELWRGRGTKAGPLTSGPNQLADVAVDAVDLVKLVEDLVELLLHCRLFLLRTT